MKVIDLLNTNNKPKRFIYKNYIWKREECLDIYFNKEELDFETYLASVQIGDLVRSFNEVLNDEIEVIEDKSKKIEKIDKILRIDDLKCPYGENEEKIWTNIILNHNKINELIEQVNYLLERSDKE